MEANVKNDGNRNVGLVLENPKSRIANCLKVVHQRNYYLYDVTICKTFLAITFRVCAGSPRLADQVRNNVLRFFNILPLKDKFTTLFLMSTFYLLIYIYLISHDPPFLICLLGWLTGDVLLGFGGFPGRKSKISQLQFSLMKEQLNKVRFHPNDIIFVLWLCLYWPSGS